MMMAILIMNNSRTVSAINYLFKVASSVKRGERLPLCSRRPGAELLHQGEKVRHPPMLGDFAVMYSHDVDRFKMDSSTCRRHTQEGSLVRSVIGLVSRYEFSVGRLPMDFCMEIRERGTKCAVKASDAVFIRCGVWLGRMVNEVVSKEFLKDVEIPTALHFFGIAADDRFRAVR